jgi:ATP-binding cassette, subfamily F, member 2
MDIAKMKAFVAKFGAGSRASQAKSKIKAIDKRSKEGISDKPAPEKTLKFRFEEPAKVFGALIQFRDASFYYTPGEYLYKNLEFGINMESRIALVGPNGVGKSTLLKLIAGDLEPSEGAVSRSPHIRVGRFHQHFMDQLNMEQTPLDFLMSEWKDEPIEGLRASLGRFGVSGSQQLTPMKKLSGGLKSRVIFCYIARQIPDLLLLDEPTNHLDMETIDTLSDAINEFKGAVLVVSHDTRLISNISNEIFLVENKTVVKYEGTIMDYRAKIIEEKELDLEA